MPVEDADEITENDVDPANVAMRAGYLRGLAITLRALDENDRVFILRAARSLRACVALLSGAGGGEAPREAREGRSEVPGAARHPHPLVTTATLPASVHPPSNQPSSARGEGTPSKFEQRYGPSPKHRVPRGS